MIADRSADNSNPEIEQPGNTGADKVPLIPKGELIDEVYAVLDAPVDRWAVAATLESLGIRDVDARDEYGQSLFDLAEEIFGVCRSRGLRPITQPPVAAQLRPPWVRFLVDYGQGWLFALPLVSQLTILFLLRVSLFASLALNQHQATVVILGAVLSYIVTGGVIQSVSRRAYGYVENGLDHLARQLIFRMVRLGTGLVLLVALLILLLNVVTPVFDTGQILLCLLYFVLLSELWLVFATFYLIKQPLLISVWMFVGVGVVLVAYRILQWNLFLAQTIGMSLAGSLAWWYSRGVINTRAERIRGSAALVKLPKDAIMAFVAGPYAAYGFLYFTFLFADRLMAWTAAKTPIPSLIWFRPAYEIGLDLSIIPLLLIAPVVEHAGREFSRQLEIWQSATEGFRLGILNQALRRHYLRQWCLVILVGGISLGSAAVLFGVPLLHIPRLPFLVDETTRFVFVFGTLGYMLWSFGLLNAGYCLALNQPGQVARILAMALATNLLVGYTLSRLISYEYAVLGFVVGGLVFVAVSTRDVYRMLGEFYNLMTF